jgi:hypothetical protein
MEASFIVLLYRYYLFGMSPDQLSTEHSCLQPPSSSQVIIIVSNAIICSAAAWNLPISQNTGLHGKMAAVPDKLHSPLTPIAAQSHIDAYMIFLGAFSLLLVIPM